MGEHGVVEQAILEAHGQGSGSSGDFDLNALARECKRIADDHGFKDASIPEDVALMHSELSELLEDFREGKLAHEMEYTVTVRLPNGMAEVHAGVTAAQLEQMRRGGLVVGIPTQRDAKVESAKPCGIPSEVADVIIRALHFSAKHGIDVHGAVIEKMAYNKSRPYKHGNKTI